MTKKIYIYIRYDKHTRKVGITGFKYAHTCVCEIIIVFN